MQDFAVTVTAILFDSAKAPYQEEEKNFKRLK